MAIEMSALWREVKLVASDGIKPVAFRWEAVIHANGEDVKPYHVETVDLTRNYVKNHADVWIVRLNMAPGTYDKKVLPYKANLEITLRKIPITESGNSVDKENPVESLRFRAIPIDTSSKQMEGGNTAVSNSETADNIDVQVKAFQLIDPVIERLRMVSVGGIYRGAKPTDVIRSVLGYYSQRYSKDGDIGPLGVNVVDSGSDAARTHYIVPHATPLFNVPTFIHDECGGVYNGGIAFYYQNRMWYVFPPYDVTQYQRSTKTLTVINIPPDRLPEPDRSYRVTPTQVIVLGTGDTMHVDTSDHKKLNEGNGVRFIDARNIMEGFLKVKGNKAVIDRTKNVNEFVMEKRETGLNMIRQSSARITDNYHREYSKLAFRNGAFVQIAWENSKDSLLYPGMPVKYLYIENNVPHEVYGVLVGADSFSSPQTPGPSPKKYITKTALTLFINSKIEVGKEVQL